MPLNQQLVAACPLLLPRDRLQLHPSITLTENYFLDTELGAQHQYHASGRYVLRLLQNGIEFSVLQQRTKRRGISDSQLLELLGFLNKTGLLVRHSGVFDNLLRGGIYARDVLLGVRHARFGRRTSATPTKLLIECIRTTRLVAGIATLYSLLLFGVLDNPLPALTPLLAICIVIFSIYLHELCHILIVRRHTQQLIIARGGSSLGVIHKKLPHKAELLSAAAGPLGTLLFCSMLSLLLWLYGSVLLAGVSLAIGLVHLGSFLPHYSDGAILFRNLRKKVS
ncbi:MAG TPA: hypothetical protein VD907_06525 [Verrucomicrobiae bacterium]|nr:hypothetical protein [Verrucomicrobiae bacterium]